MTFFTHLFCILFMARHTIFQIHFCFKTVPATITFNLIYPARRMVMRRYIVRTMTIEAKINMTEGSMKSLKATLAGRIRKRA